MKKKVQAIIKNPLSGVDSARFTLIVLLGCYFFVIRTHGDGQAAKVSLFFSDRTATRNCSVSRNDLSSKKRDPFRHGYVVGRTRSSRFWRSIPYR